jgi:hypothetical protein
MKKLFTLILTAFSTFLLASCGGGSSSTSSTTPTPSAQLEATVASLCKTNCNAIVPADNPSSRLETTIKALNPNASTTVPADNPSARLEAAIAALQAR